MTPSPNDVLPEALAKVAELVVLYQNEKNIQYETFAQVAYKQLQSILYLESIKKK